ncbi:MAG: protein-tyrosine-phosphatase [Maribacter sp.]|nr:protein-tyrosine-phosphatase [Maribacter sp.]
MTIANHTLFNAIEDVISSMNSNDISVGRKTALKPLIDFIQKKVNDRKDIRLNFICTHNSRRSHLAQVWAQTMASYFNVKNVFCYSGGTEATALFPVVAGTLKKYGFQIQVISEGNNPIFSIKYAENESPVVGFSKKFDNPFNPQSEFAAIMTCSQADNDCPFIPGAEKRIPIPFEDPKLFDNTPQQNEKYKERSLQIASELFYVFSQIQSK